MPNRCPCLQIPIFIHQFLSPDLYLTDSEGGSNLFLLVFYCINNQRLYLTIPFYSVRSRSKIAQSTIEACEHLAVACGIHTPSMPYLQDVFNVYIMTARKMNALHCHSSEHNAQDTSSSQGNGEMGTGDGGDDIITGHGHRESALQHLYSHMHSTHPQDASSARSAAYQNPFPGRRSSYVTSK